MFLIGCIVAIAASYLASLFMNFFIKEFISTGSNEFRYWFTSIIISIYFSMTPAFTLYFGFENRSNKFNISGEMVFKLSFIICFIVYFLIIAISRIKHRTNSNIIFLCTALFVLTCISFYISCRHAKLLEVDYVIILYPTALICFFVAQFNISLLYKRYCVYT